MVLAYEPSPLPEIVLSRLVGYVQMLVVVCSSIAIASEHDSSSHSVKNRALSAPARSLPAPARAAPARARAADSPVKLARRPDHVAIRMDGALDETAWEGLPVHRDFRVIDPDTLAPAPLATELRMFYTDRGFYLGVEMAQPANTLVEYLSGRDQWLSRDSFSFTLDTSGEGRYGFWFALSLGDSVADGTILPERQYSSSWDGAWQGATARTATGWSAEYFIPWALVNMPKMDGARTLGIYAQRNVAHANERHAWPPLPWTKPTFLSAFATLELRDVSPRQQYSLTPYVATVRRFPAQRQERLKAGIDLLWRPSSNFQLTSTLNPDFGNVEADDMVINLSNYETFFPEKRLFFQEGQEIFSAGQRASSGTSLLHTRRIGAPPLRPATPEGVRIDPDELARPADLLGAVKASGQRGRLRYGVLGVLEDDVRLDAWDGDEHLRLRQQGRDFGALRLLYEDADDGYRALGLLSTIMRHPQRRAEVTAVDGQYRTAGAKFRVSSQIVASNITGDAEDGAGGFVDMGYTPRQGLSHYLSLDAYDDAIQLNDMGFQSRNDYRSASYRLRLSSPRRKHFRNTRTRIRLARMWNTAGKVIGADVSVNQNFTLHSLSQVRLTVGFTPAHYDDRGSFGNGSYRLGDTWNVELRYDSDAAQRLAYSFRQRWRQEVTRGAQHRTRGNIRWRTTDRFTLALGMQYTNRDSWLLHQAADQFAAFKAEQVDANADLKYFFTAHQHLAVGFQWVGVKAAERNAYRLVALAGELRPASGSSARDRDFAISRVNVQVRYHWEIAPLSDVYVIYTRDAALARSGVEADPGFGELFSNTVDETAGEHLALKFRYRFGS